MKLFVTGGAGLTGCNFLRFYLSDNSDNTAIVLVRQGTNHALLPEGFAARMQLVEGDIRDENLGRLMAGCDAVMHIADKALCPEIVKAALSAGVNRVFFVTTTGILSQFSGVNEGYKVVEKLITDSGLDWTILRPTTIFGSERDANMHKLLRYLNTHRYFPVFGDGKCLIQPVFAEDLAMGLLQSLKCSEKTTRKVYNLPGRSPMTYNEMVKTATDVLSSGTRLIHIPLSVSLTIAAFGELLLGKRSPVTKEQIRRLTEDKSHDWNDARDDFGYNPGEFADKIELEVIHLRSIRILV